MSVFLAKRLITLLATLVGTSVVVFLELPGLLDEDGKPAVAVVTSTVRWTTPQGMGVQFGPMGVRETHALVRALTG